MEAWPLHLGQADAYDCAKRAQLGRIIFVSGGLRARYPLLIGGQVQRVTQKTVSHLAPGQLS